MKHVENYRTEKSPYSNHYCCNWYRQESSFEAKTIRRKVVGKQDIHSLKASSHKLLKKIKSYNWHTKSCTYLIYTAWGAWRYVYTRETSTITYAINTSVSSRNFLLSPFVYYYYFNICIIRKQHKIYPVSPFFSIQYTKVNCRHWAIQWMSRTYWFFLTWTLWSVTNIFQYLPPSPASGYHHSTVCF